MFSEPQELNIFPSSREAGEGDEEKGWIDCRRRSGTNSPSCSICENNSGLLPSDSRRCGIDSEVVVALGRTESMCCEALKLTAGSACAPTGVAASEIKEGVKTARNCWQDLAADPATEAVNPSPTEYRVPSTHIGRWGNIRTSARGNWAGDANIGVRAMKITCEDKEQIWLPGMRPFWG